MTTGDPLSRGMARLDGMSVGEAEALADQLCQRITNPRAAPLDPLDAIADVIRSRFGCPQQAMSAVGTIMAEAAIAERSKAGKASGAARGRHTENQVLAAWKSLPPAGRNAGSPATWKRIGEDLGMPVSTARDALKRLKMAGRLA